MVSLEAIRRGSLWTLLAVSAFASIEPSPYEFMFVVLLIAFASGGLAFDRTLAPMILTMAIFNAAGLVALAPYIDDAKSVAYTVTSLYIALTMIVFAAVVADRPQSRMATIRSGYIFAALVAAALAISGYFDIAGLGPYFTLYDNTRAMGPFKDPNVFGPFLVAPIVWLTQDALIGRGALGATLLKLLPLTVALGLSFSRGAVLDAALALMLLFGLTFVTAASARERQRTLYVAFTAAALLALILAIALAIPTVRDMMFSRASLIQDYDGGVEGRFGNQIRAIPLLLERPLGFGPLRFSEFFPQDPHEAFLSAFAYNGWAGGLAFAAFIAGTIYIGWRLCLSRSPLRVEAIALWSACFPQILQGVQIDTEHWRHLFLLCGCVYGLAAAARSERRASVSVTPAPIFQAR